MGTASLIAGIGLMIVGFAVIAQGLLGTYFTVEQMRDWIIFNTIIGLPFVIAGGLLLRKYDRDKKKEKHPKTITSPYVCEHCDFIGKSEEDLTYHYVDKHPRMKR